MRVVRFPRVAFCAAAVGLASAARGAQASPACACDDGPELVLYTNAPTNVRLLVAASTASPPPTLAPKSGGAPVPVGVVPAGDDAAHVWIVPASELAPNADYVLGFAAGGFVEVHTGAGADRAPPTLTGVASVAGGFPGACPDQIAAVVSAAGLSDDTGASWLRVAFDGPAGHHVVLVATSAPPIGRLSDRSCGNAPWAAEGSYAVRASAIDQAGNESAAVGPATFTMGRVRGRGSCLCRAGVGVDAGVPDAAALAFVAAAAVVRLRGRARMKT
jgi:hypothetical protein